MFNLPTVVSLLLLAVPSTVYSSPCVTFDSSFNLLVFGLDSKDWNAGQQSTWTSGSATDITTSGRPSFDGTNTTCYLSQFYNAVYVMNGDSSNPSSVYIYDAGAQSWSTQSVTTGKFNPASFEAILDHDTNVIYALSGGDLFYLNMGDMKTANSTALSWVDVEQAPYPSGYEPVMALAQNHIHFLDIPNVPAGDADIFVIHYSYFQPQPQSYPLPNGSAFPATHGKTASFFQMSGVQQEFAFIPDDGAATYVINVETNSTEAYAGPMNKDSQATYAASITSLVQLDSAGALSFLPYTEGDVSTNSQATWSAISKVAAVAPPGQSSSAFPSGSNTASGHASSTKSSASSTGTASAGSSSSANGAVTIRTGYGFTIALAGALGVVACFI
ncbi:hypothetical protein SCP_1103350 [Sparassis crispa]|uniref:Uncharacterized protein n=1 Tax=Sparassis crispa TaxID=139825 RepID=A0A401GZS7_9APHY|nr:hypothetical protein SCP_1103350 [Sparassis crispa]GBE87658.1 hypothetical protein SCP_1103350 [Sparassis crispa]